MSAECKRSKYAKIYILGRTFTRVDEELMPEHSTRLAKVEVDICIESSELRATIAREIKGPVDDFINTIGSFSRGAIADLSDAAVSSHFLLNCVANITLIRAVLPLLTAQRHSKQSRKRRLKEDEAAASTREHMKCGPQMLICSASLALQARSPYALQSATKAGLKFFVDALRIELKGSVRVMCVYPPSVATDIFAKAGDHRPIDKYPPASRVADVMRFMLECPQDVSIPELLLEQHCFNGASEE